MYRHYFETGDIVLVVKNLWSLGLILEEKPNKIERGLVRRVRLKTKSMVLERSIDETVLLEAPRLHNCIMQ